MAFQIKHFRINEFLVLYMFVFQFVPFREFMRGSQAGNTQYSQAALAKEVLAEVPEQFLQYMKKFNLKPKTHNGTAPPVS